MALVSRGMSLTTYQELSEYRNVFSCLLCLEFFSNPRVLDCHHIFCEQCLEAYYKLFRSIHFQPQQHGVVMPCPTCRRVTTALAGGPLPHDMTNDRVLLTRRKLSRQADISPKCDPCALRERGDPADFFCNKCTLNMCRTCRTAHDQHHLFTGHVIIHVSNKETLDLYCDTHSKMPSIYFCLDCSVAACVVCILHCHMSHRTSKLRDALSIRRDHLKTLLNEFGPRLDKIEAKIKRLASFAAADDSSSDSQQPQQQPKTPSKTGGLVPPLFYRKSPENGSRHRNSEFDRFGKGNSTLILDRRMVRSASSPANYATRTFFGSSGGRGGGVGGGGGGTGAQERQRKAAVSEKLRNWYIEETSLDSSSSDSSRDSLIQCSNNCKEVDTKPGRNNGTNATPERSLDATDASTERRATTGSNQALTPMGYGRRRGVTCISPPEEISPPSDLVTAERLAVTLAELTMQTTRHRKLYNLSTKILEMSQSKKLFAIYEDIVDRIQTVLDAEMQFIQDVLEEHISLEMSRRKKKNSSFVLEQSSRDFRNGASTSSSSADSDSALLSMLIRPKLLWKVEKQRSDITEMWNPCDVAFLPDESVIVAEYDNISDRNNKLQIFDQNGRPLEALAQGQIQPLGVAVTREGHIAVTDCKGKRIKILTTSGQTVMDIGKGQFGWPYGIAVNSRGQLIVTDAFNDTVSIYQMDGKRTKIFGSTGSQNSQFRNPYHVTVDARDNIIVSDSGNSCIKVFDASGKFLFYSSEAMRKPSGDVIGERTVKRRKLRGPRGVAVDLKGNILVADDCCRVCMFDSSGRYVRNLLTEEDSVKFPEAVHCSRGGLLAVTEWNPSNMFAVKMFNMYE